MDTAVQYFTIDNSHPVLRRRNAAGARLKMGSASEPVSAREGEKSIRNRVLRANSGWVWGREKLVGGNGGLTRIICGISEKRKTGRVHVVRVYTCERVRTRERKREREWGRKDGECMKRERNDGKRGWREYTGR